jgi:hypothetical protein
MYLFSSTTGVSITGATGAHSEQAFGNDYQRAVVCIGGFCCGAESVILLSSISI